MTYPDSVFNLPPSEAAPVQQPKPILGIGLLVLAVVGVGGLFVQPVRLIALGLLIVLTAVVALVWFRARTRTTMVLTVTTLGVLGIGLGVGIAVLLAGRFGSSADGPAPPLDVQSSANQGEGAPGFVGPSVVPGMEPPPPSAQNAPPPAAPNASNKPKPSTKPSATQKPSTPAKPDAVKDKDPKAKDREAKDREAKDRASTEAEPKKERPRCSFGDVKPNADGSAELCGSNGNWEHTEQDGDGDWRKSDRNSGSNGTYGEYGYFGEN